MYGYDCCMALVRNGATVKLPDNDTDTARFVAFIEVFIKEQYDAYTADHSKIRVLWDLLSELEYLYSGSKNKNLFELIVTAKNELDMLGEYFP